MNPTPNPRRGPARVLRAIRNLCRNSRRSHATARSTRAGPLGSCLNCLGVDAPPRRQDEELREFFVPFGTVEDAVVIMERDDPGRSRGFGFVTYTPARPGAVD